MRRGEGAGSGIPAGSEGVGGSVAEGVVWQRALCRSADREAAPVRWPIPQH